MLSTLWIHSCYGDDLLLTIETARVCEYVRDILETGMLTEAFTEDDAPLINYCIFNQGNKLIAPEYEIDMLSCSHLQIILTHEGFLPPAHMYSKIFLITPEAAKIIITNIYFQSIEHFMTLNVTSGIQYNLTPREEPYDIRTSWQTEAQLDEELYKYMNVPVTP